MLQNIRQNVQGTAAKVVVGLIVISFSLFGLESILVGGGGSEVAEVNGEPIFPQQLQQAVDTQKRRLIAMMGENFDPTMLDDDQLGAQALDGLINRQLLMQSASDMGLLISDTQISAVVTSMEEFQVDGAFSPEVYRSVLSSAGYTPIYFKQSLYDDMVVNQLRSGLAGSEFVTPAELEVSTKVLAEQRDLQYFSIPRASVAKNTPLKQKQINEYYESHQDLFRTPESVDIDYLELTLDDFRKPVAESAIQEAYELTKHESQFQTQSRVSHILFQGDAQEQVAKAKAQLDSGESFADVAKALSEDPGSADKGGDLGFTSGNTFPAAMEAAIAQLEPGVVSAPVETDAGTHLILVTERQEGEQASLDDMRDQLVNSIQTDEARVELLRTVEALKDLSFNAEDLAYPAKELGLTVAQADAITRAQNEGLFSNSVLIDAAFSEDVLQAGHNSDVIELAGDRFVVLNVRQHNESAVKPLPTVRKQVVAALREELAREAVAAKAEQLLGQLHAGMSLAQVAAAEGLQSQVELGVDRGSSTLAPEVLRRVFELPAPQSDTLAVDYVIAPNGDAIVVELLQVSSGDFASLSEAEKNQLRQALSGELGSLVDNEFQRGLRERAKITVL